MRLVTLSVTAHSAWGLAGRLSRPLGPRRRLGAHGASLGQLDLSTTSQDARRRNQDAAAVFVCTGASRGLGLEFTRQLLSRTAGTVVGVTRKASGGDGPSRLKSEFGERYQTVHADLMAPTDIAQLPTRLAELGIQRVDLLVNTAGVLHATLPGETDVRMPERSLAAVTPEWMEYNFKLNTMAPLLLAQSLAPLMKTKSSKENRPLSVVANLSARVGSISDNRLGGWYSYRISKAAQNMATRNLSLELKRQGTLVIGLHPGTVDTGLSKPFQKNVADGKLFTAEFSVNQLLSIIDAIEQNHTGEVFAWDGAQIPY